MARTASKRSAPVHASHGAANAPLRRSRRRKYITTLQHCTDDVILCVASFLTSHDLVRVALTCQRFGAKNARASTEGRRRPDDADPLEGGASVAQAYFAIPEGLEGPDEAGRRGNWIKCAIINPRDFRQRTKVKFYDKKLKRLGVEEQWVGPGKMLAAEQMQLKLRQSARYYIAKEGGGTISVRHKMLDRSLDNCGERMAQRKIEWIEASLQGERELSLMEEAARRTSMAVLNVEGKGCGCFMEDDSWIGIYQKLELELLFEAEDRSRQASIPGGISVADLYSSFNLDRFLSALSEGLNTITDELQQDRLVRRRGLNMPGYERVRHEAMLELKSGCILSDDQWEDVGLLALLYDHGVCGGFLQDTTNMGGQLQVMALIAYLYAKEGTAGPFLVIAPYSKITRWINQFKKMLPSLPIVRLAGSVAERKEIYSGPLNPQNEKASNVLIIVTSYEVALEDTAQLNTIGASNSSSNVGVFSHIFVDEGPSLLSHRCSLISCVNNILCNNLIYLMGGPMNRDLYELSMLLLVLWKNKTDYQSAIKLFPLIMRFASRNETVSDARREQVITKIRTCLMAVMH